MGVIISQPSEQMHWWNLFFRPLLTIEQASELLDEVERHSIVAYCQEGKLRGWNIATSKDTRPAYRIALYSVQWLGESSRRGRKLPVQHPPVESLFPHQRANLLHREAAQFLQCDEAHVRNLTAAAQLDGPQFSERQNRVARTALTDFLNRREIHLL